MHQSQEPRFKVQKMRHVEGLPWEVNDMRADLMDCVGAFTRKSHAVQFCDFMNREGKRLDAGPIAIVATSRPTPEVPWLALWSDDGGRTRLADTNRIGLIDSVQQLEELNQRSADSDLTLIPIPIDVAFNATALLAACQMQDLYDRFDEDESAFHYKIVADFCESNGWDSKNQDIQEFIRDFRRAAMRGAR